MDNIHKPTDSECYTLSLGPFRLHRYAIVEEFPSVYFKPMTIFFKEFIEITF
jgi:hypothetical protein